MRHPYNSAPAQAGLTNSTFATRHVLVEPELVAVGVEMDTTAALL
jgi:hypothetical protein